MSLIDLLKRTISPKDAQVGQVIVKPQNLADIAYALGLPRIGHRQYNLTTTQGQALAYAYCSIVRSVINIKTSACAEFKPYAYDIREQIIEKPQELRRLNEPNSYQDLREFVVMTECYMQIFGKAYIVKVPIVGMENEFSIYVVPNPMVTEVEEVNTSKRLEPLPRIKEYLVSIGNGLTITLQPEDIFVVRDISPDPLVWGGSQSRLSSIEPVVNSFVSSFEAVNELMVNRGMLGIISLIPNEEKSIMLPETKSDKELVEKRLKRYGILENQLKYIITSFKSTFTPVSATITDLGLTDVQNQCMREIATAYQVPTALLESAVAKYNNQATAQRDLYIKAIIPETKRIFSVLNKIYNFQGFEFVPAFDHLSIFREDMYRYASALKSMVEALAMAEERGYKSTDECKNELASFTITTI